MSSSPRQPSEAADRVEAAVAARIAPSAEFLARVERVRAALPERVREVARTRSSPLVRALVAGSAARGTFLSDRLDIDLFLLFPPDLPRDRLREEGLALGRAVLTDTETRYAEHPYLRGRYEGFSVDAVPGFAITDPSHPLSAVDRTPFHQAYLSERETPALVSQVRLAKQFLRGLGVYGSESKTEGFSGYLVELLVLKYGSLRALLTAARRWRIPARLMDPREEAPGCPRTSRWCSPIRWTPTGTSRRRFRAGTWASSWSRPGPTWRTPRSRGSRSTRPRTSLGPTALELASQRASHVTVIELPRPDLVDDTLYPQIRKAEGAIADEARRAGFEVLGSGSAVDPAKVVVVLEVAHRLRSPVRRRDGPRPGSTGSASSSASGPRATRRSCRARSFGRTAVWA